MIASGCPRKVSVMNDKVFGLIAGLLIGLCGGFLLGRSSVPRYTPQQPPRVGLPGPRVPAIAPTRVPVKQNGQTTADLRFRFLAEEFLRDYEAHSLFYVEAHYRGQFREADAILPLHIRNAAIKNQSGPTEYFGLVEVLCKDGQWRTREFGLILSDDGREIVLFS